MTDVWVLVQDGSPEWRRTATVEAEHVSGATPGHMGTGEVIAVRRGVAGSPLALPSTDEISPAGTWWRVRVGPVEDDKMWEVFTPASMAGTEQAPTLVGALPQVSPGSPPPGWVSSAQVPAGGAAGEVLAKVSGGDYDTEWTAGGGGGVQSVDGDTGPAVDLTGTYTPLTDPRLSDARTPTSHAATHATGGSDPLIAADVGADQAGSASAAQQNAENYTDSAISGLGGAAALDVGTGAGDVAPGDVGSVLPATTHTASYTLTAGDAGQAVDMDSASPTTVTVPAETSVPWSVGTMVEVVQLGAGVVSIAGAAGVTIVSLDSKTDLAGQGGSGSLRYLGSDRWHLAGALA